VKFIRAATVLTFRFRPGKEWYAVMFSIRDTLIVLSPLFSEASTSIVLVTILLYVILIAIAHDKPWRLPQANSLSIVVQIVLLTILDLGSFFVDST
ncbi:RPS6, partial [Symbiodinium natans]